VRLPIHRQCRRRHGEGRRAIGGVRSGRGRFRRGNASYTATRITESAPGVSATVGQEVLDTPKWMGSLYGDYRFLNSNGGREAFAPSISTTAPTCANSNRCRVVTYPNGTFGQVPDATQSRLPITW